MWMDAIQYIINGRSIIWYSVFWCLLQERSGYGTEEIGRNHASVEAPAAESVTVNVIEEVKDEKEETAAEVAGIKVPPLFR